MFLHLPTRETLDFVRDFKALESSIREHAPLAEVLFEAVTPAALSFWVSRRYAPRLESVVGERRRVGLAFAVVATAALASWVRTTSSNGQEFYGAVGPVAHLATKTTEFDLIGKPPSLETIAAVQHAIATDNPGPPTDFRYPFCARPQPPSASGKTGRSALLLILESVDKRSLDLKVGGVPVMPNLNRMAMDGVLFPRFFSTGNMSVFALPPLFGGVPAVPVRALLLKTPLDNVLGYPGILRREGYDTAFIYAVDLTFSHQDEFVKRVGFETIVPMPANLPRYGWGAADGAMFDLVKGYIENERGSGKKPYFAIAFTGSTHDPYTLPPDHKRKFSGTTQFDLFVEALAYLDDELGRFYDWFARAELPRGTVLAITGDHAPRVAFPGDPADTTTGEFEYRFQVPLILLGLNSDETRRAQKNAARTVGGHQDVPATLATALGVAPPRCHQGRSLLGTEVPSERLILSVAGEGLQFLYAHGSERRFMLDLRAGLHFHEHEYLSDPTFRRDISKSDPDAPKVERFLFHYLDLMEYAIPNDKLSPPPEVEAPSKPALPHVAAAAKVCRGLPPGGSRTDAGVVSELEGALVDHPEWLELSVTSNAEGGLVVRHWKEPPPADPFNPSFVTSDTTAEGPGLSDVVGRLSDSAGLFLDIERPLRFAHVMSLVHGMVAAIDRLPPGARVVVESSDEVMLTSVRRFSKVSLAYRVAPGPASDEALKFAAERGFDWVCLAEDFASPSAIRAVHAHGLRVVTYPRGPSRPPSDFAEEPPDARVVN
jgi:arylsulfatase A-like enzyme